MGPSVASEDRARPIVFLTKNTDARRDVHATGLLWDSATFKTPSNADKVITVDR